MASYWEDCISAPLFKDFGFWRCWGWWRGTKQLQGVSIFLRTLSFTSRITARLGDDESILESPSKSWGVNEYRYNDHEASALDTKATWFWLLLDSKPIKAKLDLKQWGLVAIGNCLYLSKLWEPGLERMWESSRKNMEIWLLLGRIVFALALREPLKLW